MFRGVETLPARLVVVRGERVVLVRGVLRSLRVAGVPTGEEVSVRRFVVLPTPVLREVLLPVRDVLLDEREVLSPVRDVLPNVRLVLPPVRDVPAFELPPAREPPNVTPRLPVRVFP